MTICLKDNLLTVREFVLGLPPGAALNHRPSENGSSRPDRATCSVSPRRREYCLLRNAKYHGPGIHCPAALVENRGTIGHATVKTLIANPSREARRLRRSCGSALLFGLCWLAWPAAAQVPGIISEQGTLFINGTNFDGNCQFKFALVDAMGTRTFWSHDDTSIGGGEPARPGIELPVVQGVFAVNLGDLTVPNMTRAIPASVFTNKEVYLRVWVNDGANGWQRLVPDRQMTAVGDALAAQTLTGPIQAAQLPGTVAQLNKAQLFTRANYFLGSLTALNASNLFVGRFVGDGSGLTNIRASSIGGRQILPAGHP